MNAWAWAVLFICSAVVLVTMINRFADHMKSRPDRVGDRYGHRG